MLAGLCIIRSLGGRLLPVGILVPKEKDNETFAQGVIAVGRSGRHGLCLYSQSARSGGRPDSRVPTEDTKLWRISRN